jgi:hypothetical protein
LEEIEAGKVMLKEVAKNVDHQPKKESVSEG